MTLASLKWNVPEKSNDPQLHSVQCWFTSYIHIPLIYILIPSTTVLQISSNPRDHDIDLPAASCSLVCLVPGAFGSARTVRDETTTTRTTTTQWTRLARLALSSRKQKNAGYEAGLAWPSPDLNRLLHLLFGVLWIFGTLMEWNRTRSHDCSELFWLHQL